MVDERVTISVVLRDLLTGPARNASAGLNQLNRGFQALRNVSALLIAPVRRLVSSFFNLRTAIAGLVAGGSIALVVRQLRDSAAAIDTVAKQSRQLGLSTQNFTALGFAAGQSGVEVEKLRGSLQRFSTLLVEIGRSGDTRGLLSNLGLSASDLRDANGELRDVLELFSLVGGRIANLPSATERIAALREFFGRAGADIGILFEGGQAGVEALFEEAQRLGGILTPEQGAIAEQLSDAFGRLAFAIQGFRNRFVEALGPSFTEILNRLAFGLGRFGTTVAGFVRPFAEFVADFSLLLSNLDQSTTITRFSVQGTRGTLTEEDTTVGAALLERFRNLLVNSIPLIQEVLANLVTFTVTGFLEVLIRFLPQFLQLVVFVAETFATTVIKVITTLIPALGNAITGAFQSSGSVSDIADAFAAERRDAGAAIARIFTLVVPEERAALVAFVRSLADEFRSAEEAVVQFNSALAQSPSEFAELTLGFSEGATQATSSLRGVLELGQQLGNVVGQSILTLADTLVDAAINARNFGEAFRDVAASVLQQVASLITQFLLLQALSALVPGFGTTFGLASRGGRAGSLPEFASGGFIPGPPAIGGRDNLIIAAQRGEFVVNPRQSAMYGAGLAAINAGQVPRNLLSAFAGAGAGDLTADVATRTGMVGSGGSAGPSIAIVAPSDRTLDRLLAGGRQAFLQFMRDNSGEINGALSR